MSTDSTPRPLSLARGREKSTSFSYEYRIVREKAAVVLELGTAFFKCGFSQEHSPRHVSASTLPAFLRETASARPTFKQWKLYAARVLKWVFFVALQTKPTERPVVLVEDHLMSTYFRRALVTCLFEVFEVPMVLFLPKAVGALTLTGTTTGIVLDVGEHETRVMPVYDSHLLIDAFTYIRLGVSDAKTDLARMIVAQRNELIQSLDPDEFGDVAALAEQVEGVRPEQADSTWIHDITVRLAAVDSKDQIQSDARKQADAIDGGDESKEGDFASSIGGGGAAAAAAISITKDSKWSLLESIFESSPRMHQVVRAGYEVLFSGTIDSEGNTLVTSVLDCLCKCQIDLRSTLAQNIIVVGGGAAAANISFRLQQEIDAVMDALAANEQTKDDAADGEQQQEHSTRPISSNLPFGGRFDNIACLGKYHGVRVRPLAPFNGSLAAWTGTSVFATSNAFNRSQSAENEPMSTPGMSTGRPGGHHLFRFPTMTLADFQADRTGPAVADRFSIAAGRPLASQSPSPSKRGDTSPLATVAVAKHFISSLTAAREKTVAREVLVASKPVVGSNEWIEKMAALGAQRSPSRSPGGGAASKSSGDKDSEEAD